MAEPIQVKDLTWDNDGRIWGVNPVVRPEVNNVLGHYAPLGPVQGWRREGFQDSLDKAGGWIIIALLSRPRTLVGELRRHVGGEELLDAVCGQGRPISGPHHRIEPGSVADHEQREKCDRRSPKICLI